MATQIHPLTVALPGTAAARPEPGSSDSCVLFAVEASGVGRWAQWIFCMLICAGAAGVVLLSRLEPDPIGWSPVAVMPAPVYVAGVPALLTPGHVATVEIASYSDELFAYLMFDFLRHGAQLRSTRLLLFYDAQAPKPYKLIARGGPDFKAALSDFAGIQFPTGGHGFYWALRPADYVHAIEKQTHLFDSAYNLPVRRKLEELPRANLSAYLRRFVQFKSATDPRIRKQMEPAPKALSAEAAQRLTGDILTVAKFFDLPLEFFLGIGSMENNYMNVRGDLKHSIWKRRAAPDDVVLERRAGKVRVLNDAAGVWQITRETLRHAHALTQRDKRDYSSLPSHLRPGAELNVQSIDPHLLTTYAGALLRDLLDRFDGDVTLAVSAYNGGPGRPNLRYGEGVHRAAAHARRVVEQAAVLNGESVTQMKWLRAP